MQLNEILEENSVKTISHKTKILESNLESLFAGKYDALQKTKTLGFIAIIEREYNADLNVMRDEALEYYSHHRENNSYGTRLYLDEEKKGKSKLLILAVFGLLVYASWYFLTQFDKKNLSGLIPFIDEKSIENFINENEVNTADIVADLSIANITSKEVEPEPVISKEKEEEVTPLDVSALVESLVGESNVAATLHSVSIVPVNKLWFGLVNTESKEREHFSIDQAHTLDVGEKSWLVATSSAPFSLVRGEKTEDFTDAKEHYFKIDKNNIVILSKSEYVDEGGWPQW
jgi:hypothetical protein